MGLHWLNIDDFLRLREQILHPDHPPKNELTVLTQPQGNKVFDPRPHKKNRTYKKEIVDSGKCPHCGKDCAPYYSCKKRREYIKKKVKENYNRKKSQTLSTV